MSEPLTREERDELLNDRGWGALPDDCARWEATVLAVEAERDRLRAALEEMKRHPRIILVPMAVEFLEEFVGQWIECSRVRIEPRDDGLHLLVFEARS